MIEFVLGRSASGKTTYLFSLAEKARADGQEVCLIVPEQESMTTERVCQQRYGEGVTVLSFRRLCDTLMRCYGGGARARLGDVARLGILYRAVQSVKPKLEYYRKSADRVHFYEKLMPVMEDFAAYRATGEQVLPLLDGQSSLAKYKDLFLIYESYNALRSQDYRDQFDDLDTVKRLLDEHPYFENKTVLIDNFGGFTGQEYVILEQIFLQAKDCYLTLTADPEEERLFAPTLQHFYRLQKLCEQMGLIQKTVHLSGNYRFQGKDLAVLEKYLFSAKRPASPIISDGSVRVFSAASPDAEVRLVAQDIRRRVLGGECRFKDISVVSNVQKEYQHAVEMIFDELDIPLYTDRNVDVISRPLFSMILHAMDAVQYNYRFEDMFALAGTYLCGLDHEEVARLENYVYLWNIRGKKWEMEWTQNPFGLDARETDEQKAEMLAKINDYRTRLIEPLIEFAEDTRAGKATDLLKAIWQLLENYGVADNLKKYAERETDREQAQQWLKLYDLLIELLDQLALVLGENEISRKTLHDMLEVCLRASRFGVVPAYMDQVHFGDMIRARSGEVKHLYVLGAINGKFPAGISGSNMITDRDIRYFKDRNVLLSKDSITVAKEQQFCLYRTLCSATDSITFSFSGFSADGNVQLPSTLIARITDKLLQLEIMQDPQEMTHYKDLVRAIMYLSPEDETAKELSAFLSEHFNIDPATLRHKVREDKNLSQELVEALYSKELSASQSRLERFVGCPFSYFLDYGLKLKKTEPAIFAANYIGDFVHYGMEHLLNEVGTDVSGWNNERTDAFMEQVAQKYYEDKLGDMASPRFDHLFDRIKRSMQLVGRSAMDELRHSAFRPISQEYHFEKTIPLQNGMSARVNGFIDRVDGADIDGTQWIKIVDYKTGNKSVSLEKIYNGYQLQLPLYSKMIQSEEMFKNTKIAGMEYFLAGVPQFETEAQDVTDNPDALASQFKRNGLFAADADIVHAIDNTENGLYTNAKINKNGTFDARALVANEEQMQALGAFVEKKTTQIMQRMANGEVSVCPMKKGVNACQYCAFDGICRFEYGKSKVQYYKKIDNQAFFEEITKGEE